MLPFLYTFYRFGKSTWTALKDPEFEALLTLVIVILGCGTLVYHGLEGWGYLDSFYFSVTTLLTVGFGDLSPHTATAKIFTVVYLFIGVGVLLGFVNNVAQHAVSDNKEGVLLSHRLRLRKRPKEVGSDASNFSDVV